MKALSPIITIIFLICITVLFIFFAWIWFSEVGNVVGKMQTGSANTDKTTGKTIRIESVDYSTPNSVIKITNTGSLEIMPDEIMFYVRGALFKCNPPIGALPPGGTATCIVNNNCAGGSVMVVSPGNTDKYDCE